MIIPDAPTWTLTIACPGQRPTVLTYQDPATIRQAAWRFRRSAKDCRIEARSPEGALLQGRKRWRRALRGQLGKGQRAVCIKRRGRECVSWKINGHTVHVR